MTGQQVYGGVLQFMMPFDATLSYTGTDAYAHAPPLALSLPSGTTATSDCNADVKTLGSLPLCDLAVNCAAVPTNIVATATSAKFACRIRPLESLKSATITLTSL